jgi:hypothetical protein
MISQSVIRSINSQLQREAGSRIENIVIKEFSVIKERMMEEFENHPVTMEIEAGPSSANISTTLGGYGNLFTFIGFPEGDDPISVIRRRLQETNIRKTSYKGGKWEFITTEPTREEIFAITPLPWANGRSWVDGIETGLSGLGYYLYESSKDFNSSRSGPAIQLKGGKKGEKSFGGGTGGAIKNQRSRYRRTSYISKILRDFRARALALTKRSVR